MQKSIMLAAFAAACFTQSPAVAQQAQDAIIAAPEAHSVILENEHVRVISALAAPGHISPMHSHPPMVIISLGTARAKFTSPDGSVQYADFRPGTVVWRGTDTVHSWELISGEVNVIGVEVKSAAKAAAE